MLHSPLTFKVDGAQIRLRPVDVGQYTWLCQRGIRVRDDLAFHMDFESYHTATGRAPRLSRFYAAARSLFGLGSPLYEHFNSSFSFHFLLGAHRGDQTCHYTLNLRDYHGKVVWHFNRVFGAGALNPRGDTVDPLADGLSLPELNSIFLWLHGYIWGYSQTCPVENYSPFFRGVESICLVYGLKDGKFFERRLRSLKRYEAEVSQLADEIPLLLDGIDPLLDTV